MLVRTFSIFSDLNSASVKPMPMKMEHSNVDVGKASHRSIGGGIHHTVRPLSYFSLFFFCFIIAFTDRAHPLGQYVVDIKGKKDYERLNGRHVSGLGQVGTEVGFFPGLS